MQKNIKFLAIIFLVLAIIYLFNNYRDAVMPKASPFKEKIGSLKRESVSSINLLKEKESLVLKKDDGAWKANNKSADSLKIEAFLTPLFPASEPELVSESSKKHQDFQLTKELATEVKLTDKWSILLGKSAMNGLYARFSDKDSVYLLKGLTEYSFSLTPSFWLDKTIMSLDKEKADTLSWEGSESSVSIIKKDKKWINEETGKEPVKEKFEAVFTALSPLTATDFAAKEKLADYPETPELTVSYEQEKIKDSLEFYKGESDYLVKRTSDGELFTVYSSAVDPFTNFASD